MKKIFLLTFILCFSIVFSQHFEYSLYDPDLDDGYAKIDIYNSINPSSTYNQNDVICAGDNVNIDSYIQKATIYQNRGILSFCDFDAGAHNVVNCWEIGKGPKEGGYWKSSTPTTGNVVLITSSIKNEIATSSQGFVKHNVPIPLYENLLKNDGYAELSKFYLFGPGNNINADGRVGVGCLGEYTYRIRKDGNTIRTFTGSLTNNIQTNYRFDEEGDYSILYSTKINDCLVVYEEKYRDRNGNVQKFVHRFVEEIKGTPQTGIRRLNFKVVDSDGPDFSQPDGNVVCGVINSGTIIQIPPGLIKGQSVIIPTKMTITNTYDTEIEVTKINSNFYDKTAFIIIGQEPTKDIKINSIVTDPFVSGIFKSTVKINPGETETINVYINATLTSDTPAESYNLRMNFDYSYPEPSHGCYEGGSGKGYCQGPLEINVYDDQDQRTYNLIVPPLTITPGVINRQFIEDEKDEIDISGSVMVEINEPGELTYTVYAEGAEVKLNNVLLEIAGEEPIFCSVGGDITETSNNGQFSFEKVKLNDACLKYEKFGNLVATVSATHTYEGESLSGEGEGNAQVNTNLPPLRCEIKYRMTGSSYGVEKSTEEYEMLVEIENLLGEGTIGYHCGDGTGESSDDLSERENEHIFNCEYEFDIGTSEEDATYLVTVKIKDLFNKDLIRETSCSAEVGLCLPYV